MTQMPQQCVRGEDGQVRLNYSVTVNDQKARTFLNWQVGSMAGTKEARLTHLVPLEPRKKLTPEEIEERGKQAALQQPPRTEYKNEDLGTKTIAGVLAQGHRNVRTIPAGAEGNDLPMLITTETWTAKGMGVVLFAVNEDPRYGRNTYEVEQFTVGEPDAALFLPPEGYTIKDVTPVREGVAVASASAVGVQP
jgi:hypothetical protein